MTAPPDRLIVALDVPDLRTASALLSNLRGLVSWFKVGSELFTTAGPAAVAAVQDAGGRVFLDLKFHDIPNTVAGAIAAAVGLGVEMLTLHVAGGEAMLRAAAAARGPRGPHLLGVTVLTSEPLSSEARVLAAARLARSCGLDGVVASAREAAAIKAACGADFLVASPGIRPAGWEDDDQRRTATPEEALRAGADFLVVGRPITAASSPREAAEAILRAVDAAVLQS